jgi:glycosyltransferase involved in cell wall biosynthesis
MKKVSVIIPAYNKAEYTRRTVDSVLAQTYPDIEIIVVDDGSRDRTADVMAGYGNRINYILKANGGACSARNEGIRRAAGEYIAFLDCDDLYGEDKIQRCVDLLEKSPRSGFVYTAAYSIDEHDDIVGVYDHPRSREGAIASSLILGNFICNSTVVVRREILRRAGSFDETIFTPADWDMWLRLSLISDAGYIKAPLTKYRITDNYTFNRLELARREEMYVLEKFFRMNPQAISLKNRAFSNFYMRFAQCAFIKNEMDGFWADCKASLKLCPWNGKNCLMALAALAAPDWLKKELERRILRRGT